MSTDLMKFIAAIVMYVAWGALVYLGKTDVGAFVGFTMAALGAILGHSSATVSRAVPAAVDVKQVGQGGFARPMLLALIAVIAGLSLLAGCTTTTASVARGYMTSADAGVQAFDDNAIEATVRLLCWSPYGAVVRHPEKQVGIQALCGSLANTSTLDANQLQLLMNVMGASGVKLQSIPAAAAPASAASGAK